MDSVLAILNSCIQIELKSIAPKFVTNDFNIALKMTALITPPMS